MYVMRKRVWDRVPVARRRENAGTLKGEAINTGVRVRADE